MRILSEPLGDAAPARIPGDIDHRRKGPVDTGARRLERRYAGAFTRDLGIPGGGLPERNGHHRLETMNDIAADQQRNAKATFFHGDALQLIDNADIDLVEYGADVSGLDGMPQMINRPMGRPN